MLVCRLQSLRDKDVPAIQRKADSLEADSQHDSQKLEELQADYALLEHELQVWNLSHLFLHSLAQLSDYSQFDASVWLWFSRSLARSLYLAESIGYAEAACCSPVHLAVQLAVPPALSACIAAPQAATSPHRSCSTT